jgi:hypothetical protein
MPARTRQAMLDGIGTTTIIVGGYSDGQGGICPMLAAHRNGGRTSFATFAHAWDRYTKADGAARPATGRELQTLRSMLEASIEAEEVVGQGVLGEAVKQHRAAQEGRARREEFDVEPVEPLTEGQLSTRRRPARTAPPARDTPVMSTAGT